MPVIATSAVAIRTAQSVIKTAFSAVIGDDIFEGFEVWIQDEKTTQPELAGKPYLLLELEFDDESYYSAPARERREMALKGTAGANGFNGGIVTPDAPTPSDTRLMEALQIAILTHRQEFEDAGLMMPALRIGRKRVSTNVEDGDLRENECRLTFIYRTQE